MIILIPADVFSENKVVTSGRLIRNAAGGPISKESKLRTRSSWELNLMNLRSIAKKKWRSAFLFLLLAHVVVDELAASVGTASEELEFCLGSLVLPVTFNSSISIRFSIMDYHRKIRLEVFRDALLALVERYVKQPALPELELDQPVAGKIRR